MTDIWRGRLVRLRGLEPDDWETFFTWNQDSDTARMFDYAWLPTSAVRARRWAEETATRSVADDAFFFAIEELEGGTVVGSIDPKDCDRRVGSFSYGVGVIPERRQRGYASEAILLVARYYFQELRYQKMNVQVHDDNPASIALHERLGFTREGTLRRMVYTGGVYHDQLCFGMTAEEFATLHPDWTRGG
ncbi:MAG TPA: GNAT family protein [Ktedonobacterales bacterium]|nr:GNAT family protein [Ktedonobacterales bacterium]